MNGRSSVAAPREQQQQQQQEPGLQSQDQQLQRHARANALPPAMRSTVAVADHTDDEASSVASFGGAPQPLLQNLRDIDVPTGRLQNGAAAGVSAAAASAAADALSGDSRGGSQSGILAPSVADIAAEVRAGTQTINGNLFYIVSAHHFTNFWSCWPVKSKNGTVQAALGVKSCHVLCCPAVDIPAGRRHASPGPPGLQAGRSPARGCCVAGRAAGCL